MLASVKQNDPSTLSLRRVIKRNGTSVSFDARKIRQAIVKAGQATNEFGFEEAQGIVETVIQTLAARHTLDSASVENIQDIVERQLVAQGFFVTARAYIVYREQHRRLRDDRACVVEVGTSVNEYLQQLDWRVNANANQGYSLGGLMLNVSGKVIANYWLTHVYPPEVGEAHRDADYHIHDLDMLAGYCAGWSLRTFLHEGLNGVPGKTEAKPPKHFVQRSGPDCEFSGHIAKRVGRGTSVQFV